MSTQQQRFTKTFTRHETTVDTQTGLEWQAIPFPSRMTWAEADKACRELRLGGHSDWRLPERFELESILDLTKFDPAVNEEAFPDTPSEAFWTSTPYAPSPSVFAWVVVFRYGFAGSGLRGDSSRVRAVRGSSRQFSASLTAEGGA